MPRRHGDGHPSAHRRRLRSAQRPERFPPRGGVCGIGSLRRMGGLVPGGERWKGWKGRRPLGAARRRRRRLAGARGRAASQHAPYIACCAQNPHPLGLSICPARRAPPAHAHRQEQHAQQVLQGWARARLQNHLIAKTTSAASPYYCSGHQDGLRLWGAHAVGVCAAGAAGLGPLGLQRRRWCLTCSCWTAPASSRPRCWRRARGRPGGRVARRPPARLSARPPRRSEHRAGWERLPTPAATPSLLQRRHRRRATHTARLAGGAPRRGRQLQQSGGRRQFGSHGSRLRHGAGRSRAAAAAQRA